MSEFNNDIFIKRLQNILDEKDLKQKDLADLIDVTEVTISRYINGERRPRIEIINKLAKVLGTTTDYLLGVSDIRNPYNENKEISKVDKFLLKLKEEMKKQGLKFDETSPEELIETYKLLLEFKKKTKKE